MKIKTSNPNKSHRKRFLLLFDTYILICASMLFIMFGIAITGIVLHQNKSVAIIDSSISTLATAQTPNEDSLKYMQYLQEFYKNATAYDTNSLIYTFISTSLVGLGLYVLKMVSKQKEEIETELSELAQRNIKLISDQTIIMFQLQMITNDLVHINYLITCNSKLIVISGFTVKLMDKLVALAQRLKTIEYYDSSQESDIEYYYLYAKKLFDDLRKSHADVLPEIYCDDFSQRLDEVGNLLTEKNRSAN